MSNWPPRASDFDAGLGRLRCDVVAGILPSHRCSVLELGVHFDPGYSQDFLVMVALLRDPVHSEIVETDIQVCRALALSSTAEERIDYVSEMCRMMAPRLRHPASTLSDIRPALNAMNREWDFLGVFLELDVLPEPGANAAETPGQRTERNIGCDTSRVEIPDSIRRLFDTVGNAHLGDSGEQPS